MLSSSSFSAVRHADGSSFMLCLALVQWDTGTWWPCSTPFPVACDGSWLRPASCGGWGLRRMETGTVNCCYLARDKASWCSPGIPSQVFTGSCGVVISFRPCSRYRVGRPINSFIYDPSVIVRAIVPWAYCSTCCMFLLEFSFYRASGNLVQGRTAGGALMYSVVVDLFQGS